MTTLKLSEKHQSSEQSQASMIMLIFSTKANESFSNHLRILVQWKPLIENTFKKVF